MLYSGLSVSNVLNLNGVFDQEGGELTFTNSPAARMQIEGGQFNLTNGLVTGANMFLGGTNDGYANQDSGLVSLDWLRLGSKPSVPTPTAERTSCKAAGSSSASWNVSGKLDSARSPKTAARTARAISTSAKVLM